MITPFASTPTKFFLWCFAVLCVLVAGWIGYFVHFGGYKLMRLESTTFRTVLDDISHEVGRKTILLWTMPFHDMSMVPEFAFVDPLPSITNDIIVDSPQCGRCLISFNRSLLSRSDAVVFHSPTADVQLPSKGKKDQIFVLWSQESPLSYDLIYVLDGIFDWTMSVNPHSDVYSPYASFPWILKLLGKKDLNFFEQVGVIKGVVDAEETATWTNMKMLIQRATSGLRKLKRRKALWIVSNCYTTGSRLRSRIVEEMEWIGYNIDKFGECFERPFPASTRWLNSYFEHISEYKFYLSFENSYHCKGYMTEKLWYNALYSGTVPVIWGPHRDDVAKVLPPKSYIHVEDFETLKQLVDRLNYLDKNDTAYAEYLKWRSWTKYLDENGDYSPSRLEKLSYLFQASPEEKKLLDTYAKPTAIGFCELCRKLHSRKGTRSKKSTLLELTERTECLDLDQAWNMTANFLYSDEAYSHEEN